MGHKLSWTQIRREYPDTFVLLDHCDERVVRADRHEVIRGEVVLTGHDGQMIFNEYVRRGKPPHMMFGHTAWPRLAIENTPVPSLRFTDD